jgi:uncharacterized pyridoxamine 5'-phosphate oxidase family protein
VFSIFYSYSDKLYVMSNKVKMLYKYIFILVKYPCVARGEDKNNSISGPKDYKLDLQGRLNIESHLQIDVE